MKSISVVAGTANVQYRLKTKFGQGELSQAGPFGVIRSSAIIQKELYILSGIVNGNPQAFSTLSISFEL